MHSLFPLEDTLHHPWTRTLHQLQLYSAMANNLQLPLLMFWLEESSHFRLCFMLLLYITFLLCNLNSSLCVLSWCWHRINFQATSIQPKPTEEASTEWKEHTSANGRRYVVPSGAGDCRCIIQHCQISLLGFICFWYKLAVERSTLIWITSCDNALLLTIHFDVVFTFLFILLLFFPDIQILLQ